MANESVIKEDKWTYTTCGVCYAACPIRVRTINGVPVRIEGNPYASTSKGSVCAKGVGAMTVVIGVGVPLVLDFVAGADSSALLAVSAALVLAGNLVMRYSIIKAGLYTPLISGK